jgi:hypothetical protein
LNTKILQMNEPIINTYNIYGSILSMISNDKDIWPWVYNNFVQIRYVYDWNSYFFDNHHLLFDNCPWLYHYIIPRNIILAKWNSSIKSFIIDAINNNLYIYLYVDRYYISKSNAYLKYSTLHEIFIYGYDIDENIVYVADNLLHGKYIKTKCSFDEIEKGYWSINSDNKFFLNIHAFERVEKYDLYFDLSQFITNIKNYIYSAKSIDVSFKEKCIFGMDSIYLIIDLLDKSLVDENVYLDIRAFHLFWEHKLLMELRLKYMVDNSYLINGESFICGYNSLSKQYLIIRNLVLKYNITHKHDILLRISQLLKLGLETERTLLNELIQYLVKYSQIM